MAWGLRRGLLYWRVSVYRGCTACRLGLIVRQPGIVIGLTTAFVLVKFLLLYLLSRLYHLPDGVARKLGLTLSQGREFPFVLFAAAAGYGSLSHAQANLLVLVVTLSMAITPLLMALEGKVLERLLAGSPAPPYDRIEVEDRPVIIAGYGRFGQIVSCILRLRNIAYTALEISA